MSIRNKSIKEPRIVLLSFVSDSSFPDPLSKTCGQCFVEALNGRWCNDSPIETLTSERFEEAGRLKENEFISNEELNRVTDFVSLFSSAYASRNNEGSGIRELTYFVKLSLDSVAAKSSSQITMWLAPLEKFVLEGRKVEKTIRLSDLPWHRFKNDQERFSLEKLIDEVPEAVNKMLKHKTGCEECQRQALQTVAEKNRFLERIRSWFARG